MRGPARRDALLGPVRPGRASGWGWRALLPGRRVWQLACGACGFCWRAAMPDADLPVLACPGCGTGNAVPYRRRRPAARPS